MELIILKLGGSVVTDKRVPFFFRREVVEAIGGVLRRVGEPLVLIHGGGSFGHPVAKRYGLGARTVRVDPSAVFEIRTAMSELHANVVSALSSAGVLTYSIAPHCFIDSNAEQVEKLFLPVIENGLVPITYGDVVLREGGARIVSGDEIAVKLALCLRPARVVFAIDVNGILAVAPDGSLEVLRELRPGALPRLFGELGVDVTGGIGGKLERAFAISEKGIEVRIVNGLRFEELYKSLKGEGFFGTIVRRVRDE